MAKNQILLFEREKHLERSLTLLLKQANFEVTNCNDADKTLALIFSGTAIKNKTDLLIIDIQDSNCEGNKLVKRLFDEEIVPPLIVILPYGNENIINKLEDTSDHIHLLYAPFEPTELMNRINQITKKLNLQS